MARVGDIEKLDVITSHNTAVPSLDIDTAPPLKEHDPILDEFTEAEVRKVVRRIDLR